MKYSVIIPAYNAEKTIENTVESIRNSGIADYEILIIDDGSADNTPQLCDALAEKYVEVSCVHKPNGGVSSARNLGIQRARGEYVWFFDADDRVDENCMDRVKELIDTVAPDMLIFGLSFDFYWNGSMDDRWSLVCDTETMYTRESIKADFKKLYDCNYLTACWNKLIKRSVLLENEILFDEKLFLMEDLLFSVRALKYCESIYTLPEIIYRYANQYVNSVEEERTTKRLNRIPRMSEYLKPFEEELKEQPETLAALFYMLLGQKLRTLTPKEIAAAAEDYRSSAYSSGELYELCPAGMRKTRRLLMKNRCVLLYLWRRVYKIKRKIIRRLKRTEIYKTIKGKKK